MFRARRPLVVVGIMAKGAPLAWRLEVGFDEDPPIPVLAHAPLDEEAADVARARTRTMLVPPGARKLRMQPSVR